ncbi:hypothetical protein [Janthinobacterium agaricidamnosum]|uniref:Hemerythrin-like domain-containing protein n=1 Tax=Janthinobacterium agaricidamnosum NBRC 102515 = DSM 9628 TaxID=1349767 RepID=W0V3M3_9BURK|nr:hypothetical protein [Janthinobacterium agaricidamnosum]CDG82220.1 hypothetical protein GJA_1577 [Janthinobacterium agaricidamnosum NBRC 102515 = DSM 9628]
MLTATYTLVALSVEQASVRVSLLSFQKYVQATLRQQNSITLAQLQYACDHLDRLYQTCHWRKIEMYLIPAIRQATERADRLLDELSTLNRAALDNVNAIQQRAGSVAAHTEEQVEHICANIDAFCTVLLQRLEKEERELFAIARSVICGEAWFSIANQFLAHDARAEERRRSRNTALAVTPVAPQIQVVAPSGGPDAAAAIQLAQPPAAQLSELPVAAEVSDVSDVPPSTTNRPPGKQALRVIATDTSA